MVRAVQGPPFSSVTRWLESSFETHMTDEAPRIAFLGFCDRAETITKGHHVFWHRNIMGLSPSRVFHVLPVNLRGQMIATALFRPRPGDAFKLVFRCAAAQKEFEITLELSSVVQSERRGASKPVEHAEVEQGFDGWVVDCYPLTADMLIYEPGVYKIYLRSNSHETCLGEVSIVNLALPPYTAEEVAAIRSNPFGKKLVRVEIKCTLCSSSLRVYAGLERSAKLEAEGWTWNFDISDDRYRCQCGAQDFSLAPLKNGLHGFLRENFKTPAEESDLSAPVSSVRLYEDSALQEYCRQFKELIDSCPAEEKVQAFLETHEIFFSLFLPRKLMLKPQVLTKYCADFAILNERKELLLIEIERPGLQLLRRDGLITADLQHAFGQVQDWCRVFDDHRAAALAAWGLHVEDVAKVRGVVIAGRTPTNEMEERRLRSEKRGDIDFYTHDDLLKGVTGLVRQVASV